MSEGLKGAIGYVWESLPFLHEKTKEVEQVVIREVKEMLPRSGKFYVRVAGFSGALAVIMNAYGAHAFKPNARTPELKTVFDTSSRLHLVHSAALLAVPLTNRPYLVGPLLLSGMVVFCGSCYYHAITEDTRIRKVTPYGGGLLILGWLAMML